MLIKHSRNLEKKNFLAQWVSKSYQLMLYNYLALRSLIFAFRATPTYIRTYANIRNYCLCSYSSSESFFQKKKERGCTCSTWPAYSPMHSGPDSVLWVQGGKVCVGSWSRVMGLPDIFSKFSNNNFFVSTFWLHPPNCGISALPSKKWFETHGD